MTTTELKRILTDDQKQKMKEGRERAAAEKLKADVEAMEKLKKNIEKKMSKLSEKEKDVTSTATVVEENPKPVVSEEDEVKVKAEKPAPKKKPAKDDTPKNIEPAKKEKTAEKATEKPPARGSHGKPECSHDHHRGGAEGCWSLHPELRQEQKLKEEKEKEKEEQRLKEEKENQRLKEEKEKEEERLKEEQRVKEETEKAYKKRSIPKKVKTDVWNKYIGSEIPKHKCLCCKMVTISNTDFDCGHVESEANGGGDTICNLRPICSSCNNSMKTMNMVEYVKKHGYWIG